jgi:hypothetical protein
VEAYSTRGRTRAVKHLSLTDGGQPSKFLFRKGSAGVGLFSYCVYMFVPRKVVLKV